MVIGRHLKEEYSEQFGCGLCGIAGSVQESVRTVVFAWET